jgi:hypothetical protein
MVSLLRVLFFILLNVQVAQATEAFFLEGSLGQTQTTVYSPQEEKLKYNGSSTIVRLHFPLFQSDNAIMSFTLGNQFVDARADGATAGQNQYLYYVSPSSGLSFRIYSLFFGAEYQFASIRQTTVGPSSAASNYTLPLPTAYGGFLFRLGNMGLGVIGLAKNTILPPEKSGLTTEYPFTETGAMLTVSYHFDGDRRSFFRGLFR